MRKKWFVININKKYFLRVDNKFLECQIGLGGLKNAVKKIEGDKTTPIGKWYLKSLYYRPDRILRPKFKKKNALKINQITKNCGWCDDIKSQFYNKYININNFYSLNVKYEKLWREDNAYDLIITLSHNTKPIIKNKGSAIFIHCSFSDNRNTLGCVALKKKDLVSLLKNLSLKTYLDFSSK
jgi:L,D-peptidoglycan transpeptidase YkuD (ErfK/YbiS/YcfS/YnhG family)